MKIINRNLKANEVTVQTDCLDDLWVLYKIVEKDDKITGQTQRKVRVGDTAADRKATYAIRNMTLTIAIEKSEYNAGTLRLLGPITDGPDDIPRGEHHAFAVDERTKITIQKSKWFAHQLARLEKSTAGRSSILITIFDRDSATIGLHSRQGFTPLTELKGTSVKKNGEGGDSTFYIDLARLIADYVVRFTPTAIVCGSALFWRQYLQKELALFPQVIGKTKWAEVYSSDQSGLQELLKTKEFVAAAGDDMQPKQALLFEDILRRISKNEAATYGAHAIKEACDMGAVSDALISNAYIQQRKEEDSMEELESLMAAVEGQGGQIHIVDEESPICSKLDGLGGIAALLRFRV